MNIMLFYNMSKPQPILDIQEKPSNTNNTSELENNNGETMMYMVNKLNQNKDEEK